MADTCTWSVQKASDLQLLTHKEPNFLNQKVIGPETQENICLNAFQDFSLSTIQAFLLVFQY